MKHMISALEHWIAEHGGVVHSDVIIDQGNRGRGVFASEDLEGGSLLCRVPEKLLITERLAEASLTYGQELRLAASEFSAAPGLLLITAFLLEERAGDENCQSFFAPYFRVLPKELLTSPVCWPEGHWLQSMIKGSHLERQVRAKKHSLGLEFALLQSCAPGAGVLTWKDFLWARCIVASRAYSLGSQRCLVPWADLLNHGTASEVCARYRLENDLNPAVYGDFVMCFSKMVQKGDELLQSYGEKPNASLLLDYGFVLPQAAVGVVSLSFPLPKLSETDMAVKQKKDLWMKVAGRPLRKGEVSLEVGPENLEKPLQLLSAAVILERPITQPEDVDQKMLQDEAVEIEAMKKLRHSAEQTLSKFQVIEAASEIELEDWERVSQQNCLQMLEEERRLLESLCQPRNGMS